MRYGDTKERMIMMKLEKVFHPPMFLETRSGLAAQLALEDVDQQLTLFS
jgi:hypothetical protein